MDGPIIADPVLKRQRRLPARKSGMSNRALVLEFNILIRPYWALGSGESSKTAPTAYRFSSPHWLCRKSRHWPHISSGAEAIRQRRCRGWLNRQDLRLRPVGGALQRTRPGSEDGIRSREKDDWPIFALCRRDVDIQQRRDFPGRPGASRDSGTASDLIVTNRDTWCANLQYAL